MVGQDETTTNGLHENRLRGSHGEPFLTARFTSEKVLHRVMDDLQFHPLLWAMVPQPVRGGWMLVTAWI